jgi:hypothetical protein
VAIDSVTRLFRVSYIEQNYTECYLLVYPTCYSLRVISNIILLPDQYLVAGSPLIYPVSVSLSSHSTIA